MPQVGTQTQETVITPLPPLVRNAWGDDVADTLTEWVDIELERHVVTRAEYRAVLSRVDVLESRIAAPEQAVEQNRLEFHQRFDGMQERFDGLRGELDQRLDGIQERFDQRFDGMQERFDGLRSELGQRIDALRTELKEELREHRRETRIALDDFRQEMNGVQQEVNGLRREMQEGFQTLHTQMLVQTRWMVGSLTVIGALVTLLLAIGTFVK